MRESGIEPTASRSALEDRQVIVWHLQDDEGHGRPVFVADAVKPVPLRRLPPNQLVTNGGIPEIPLLTATDPHRLCRVVVAVEVVAVALPELDIGNELFQVYTARLDFLRVVHRCAIERD